ncbi:MAG: hypothetical protein SGBAC_009832 [Bacillariaceae sp.]
MKRFSPDKDSDGRRSPRETNYQFNPFGHSEDDDVEEFFEDNSYDEYADEDENPNRIFFDPKRTAVLTEGVHEIPGSPWAKPANRPSTRPKEPLPIARYASAIAFTLTFGWCISIFVLAVWNYSSVGRIIVEIMLEKAPTVPWSNVTIQIPVYKESLQEVLMPTLKSCMRSRDYYMRKSKARCNIVVCDDGIMAFLKNNFAAAEMLWETVSKTDGKIFKLSQLLQRVPRPSRRHLKGLKSHSVYEVFHRMLFYYHYDIGFVARSTWDRRGKFKKASNLNTHLRLVWGAEQVAKTNDFSLEQSLMEVAHNSDGSRDTMFGNDISIGHLIIVNDADARMAETVILKTVPEFLNDKFLGFTQHATKTLDDQRGESYYINMLSAYTDALYQGHFLLSSILGCHPPLVGHSIFLRSEAVKQCGRIRTLRKTQRWLHNIGLPFLSVDQVGLNNLQDHGSTEYWSECHVSEDFELMIHLYNLGFNGRYVAYPDCEFQEGITRTFDEEAGRHRKFALGGHELMFNPINSWVGQGIFSPLFKTFLRSDIPSYYKIFLTAYLFSYTSGGAYLIVFSTAAIARIIDKESEVSYIYAFNSAGVLILSIVVYYVIGYSTFLFSMVRMYLANKNLLFPKYRKRGICYLIYKMVRYSMLFQILFYTVMGNYFFLGSMDHLLSKSAIVSATNKDTIHISRCTALWDTLRFNTGSLMIACYLLCLSYLTILESMDWDFSAIPTGDDLLSNALFAGPPALMALFAVFVPIILNPYILGWPFYPPFGGLCGKKKELDTMDDWKQGKQKRTKSGSVVDLNTFMTSVQAEQKLEKEIGRVQNKPDVELGSLATYEHGGRFGMSVAGTSPYSPDTTKHLALKSSSQPLIQRGSSGQAKSRRSNNVKAMI